MTFGPLGLPPWTLTFLVVLAIAGFPVALVLAWAFDVTPGGIERARPRVRATMGTRGRWFVGAAVVAAVGLGAWRLLGGPSEAGAEGIDPDLIVVIPFRVSSADESLERMLSEGVLDLLAPYLSEAPRIVDPGVTISAWRRAAGSAGAEIVEGRAVELARSLGAGRVIVGSVVGTPTSFTANARLMLVPGGELVGVATTDGSVERLGELATRLSGAILSLEAGEDPSRLEILAGVPNEALRQYLEGRRLYRQTAYVESREAFARALEIDSTFALAAVGLREAAQMGLDQARFAIVSAAEGRILANLDRLPPRDREYMSALLAPPPGRRSGMEVIRESDALARAHPDRAEAWYRAGDDIFHRAEVVALEDPYGRAKAAWDRALELDPGLHIVRQHRLWLAAMEGDTAYFRAQAPVYLAASSGTESEAGMRAIWALSFGDTAQLRWVRERTAGGPFQDILNMVGAGVFAKHEYEPHDVAALLEAMDRSAPPGERVQAVSTRLRVMRNTGRTERAEAELSRLEGSIGPRPALRLMHNLYWGGRQGPAQTAAEELAARFRGGAGPLAWSEGGADLCRLEIWRVRRGDPANVRGTAGRLRAGADDPDPAHGQNALCALLLEALAADARGEADAEPLVAELSRALSMGPGAPSEEANLELARLLEARGDFARAARAAFSPSFYEISPPYYSTMVREGARLYDLSGDGERALALYRKFLELFAGADPEFEEMLAGVRARVEGLAVEIEGR